MASNGTGSSKGHIGGWILIVLGSSLILNQLFPWINMNYVWPLALVAIGLWIVTRR